MNADQVPLHIHPGVLGLRNHSCAIWYLADTLANRLITNSPE